MKKHTAMKLVLAVTLFCIFLPMAVVVLWSVTERWPWPELLPESYSLRTVKELLFGSAKLPKILFSSISLAMIVAVLGTAIGIMTARATELYQFPGKRLVRMASFLPLLVPGTVFAMGIQITLIKLGLSDTLTGVIIVHLIAAVPYCITIMTDVTRAVGKRLEEQAMVLGADPWRAFFLVTLPSLLPGILSSVSMGFILSYSQYFTTLMVGGGRVKTIALVLVPYIQSGDRALSAVYSVAFVGSALLVFFLFETLIHFFTETGDEPMKLKIQNLTAGYDADVVLQNLSLDVEEGEFLSLLGPSGCGKTTLMKTIAGILPAKQGSIHLDGKDITNLPIHKRGTVIVFQDMRLFPHKSVAENVAFPLKMQGVPKQERLQRAQLLLEKVQLGGYGSRRPSELSGGQQQRIALARALAAQPKLLLLDEPFSALDENLREDMRTLVLQLKKEFNMTVILVTHDREEALSMSDRIALMFGGKLIQTGSPRAVYARPVSRQAADYFGNCVYIPGRVQNRQFAAPGITCPADLEDGAYTLMLRPDALELGAAGDYRLTVEAVSFRGSDTLVTLRADDGTRWQKALDREIPWNPGQILCGTIRMENGVFFREEA